LWFEVLVGFLPFVVRGSWFGVLGFVPHPNLRITILVIMEVFDAVSALKGSRGDLFFYRQFDGSA